MIRLKVVTAKVLKISYGDLVANKRPRLTSVEKPISYDFSVEEGVLTVSLRTRSGEFQKVCSMTGK